MAIVMLSDSNVVYSLREYSGSEIALPLAWYCAGCPGSIPLLPSPLRTSHQSFPSKIQTHLHTHDVMSASLKHKSPADPTTISSRFTILHLVRGHESSSTPPNHSRRRQGEALPAMSSLVC